MKTKFNGILTLLLAFVVQLTFAQEKTISGTVVDETNMPLPGATVVIKGTTTGTSTDFDGKYSITANTGDVLTFSYVGYAEQNASIGAESTIDIALALDNSLETVVVTALGFKRKPKELAYATQEVKSNEINQAKATSAATALIGKVSGLQINTVDNGVNPNTRVVLRGSRSISGNNQALIVIDGFPSTQGALSQIDPNNIESSTILKGANAAALYGSDGANGAIMITTKKGTNNEKMTVELNSTTTFETVTLLPTRQTKFGQGWNGGLDSVENTNWGPALDGSLVQVGNGTGGVREYTYSAREDNIRDFFDTGITMQNNVSVRGGGESGNIFFAASDQQTTGIVPNDKFHKNTFRLNAGKNIGKLSVNGTMAYLTSSTKVVGEEDAVNGVLGSGNSMYNQLLQTPINVPLTAFSNASNNPDEHFTNYATSPYWLIETARDNTRFDKFQGTIQLDYKFNDWLNALYRVGTNFSNSRNKAYNARFTSAVISSLNSTHNVADDHRYNRDINSDLLFNFDFKLNEDISSKFILGQNVKQSNTDRIFTSTENLTFDTINNTSVASGDRFAFQRSTVSRGIGVYGSAEFGYKDYLFLSATGRNDWSSTLKQGNNSFFYPSVGLSFIPTKVFKGLKGDILSSAKVAASYTKVGNAVADPYLLDAGIEAAPGFPFNVPGYEYNDLVPDSNLTPEFVTSTEVNVNLAFLKNRITFDAAYYTTESTDQILRTDAPYSSGTKQILLNAGTMEGDGFEIDLGARIIKTDNWKWDTKFSYAATDTEVTELAGGAQQFILSSAGYDGGASTANSAAVVGESFPSIIGTAYLRDDQGRIVINPNTGNPEVATGKKLLGKATPDYILGFNTSVEYKGIRLAAVFDYRTGHQFYNDLAQLQDFLGASEESASTNRLPFVIPNSSYETTPGTFVANTNITTESGAQPYWDTIHSNIAENYVVDATSFKCREIALSYEFPSTILDRLPIERAVIGVNARNVFMILPGENKFTDPEFSLGTGNGQGVGGSATTPPTRTIGFNVNLTF